MFGLSKDIQFFLSKLIKRQSCHHMETRNQSIDLQSKSGFYMMESLAFNELSFGW